LLADAQRAYHRVHAMAEEHPQDAQAQTPGAALVLLGDHVGIDPARRTPAYDAGPVKAYAARTVGLEEEVALTALICERPLIPREDAAAAYGALVNASLVPLVARGQVEWPASASGKVEARYAFVYRGILGAPLAPGLKAEEQNAAGTEAPPAPALGLKPEWVHEAVIVPLSRVLQDCRDKDFVHGRVNPHNIFRHADPAVTRVVLGECLATPASFAQPALYETVERAMADPVGRGLGTPGDDIYALGVTLACLLRHADPMAKMNTEAMIRHKAMVGSYTALTEGDRFSGPMLELLRGLLADDPAERWGVDSLLAWIDGRRLSPKQPKRARAAARPIAFNGQRYTRPDFLAMDLRKNPKAFEGLWESGEMETWVMRAVEDSALMGRLDTNIRAAEGLGKNAGYLDRLACYASIALDPDAPIRYGRVSVHPEGIGPALAYATAKGANVNDFGQILSCATVMTWVSSQEGLLAGYGTLNAKFDECRTYIRSPKIGYGIERCLYLLAPGCFCMSPNFAGHYVHSAEDMLRALEAICAGPGSPPAVLLDRHTVAFLAVRDKKSVEPYLYDLDAKEGDRALMGTLACLAELQRRSGIGPLPGIAKAIAAKLDPVYGRFHDRMLRAQLEKNIGDFARAGSLSRMLALLENEKLVRQDAIEFRRSQHEYARMTNEFRALIAQMDSGQTFGKKAGQQVGALISSVVAGIIILVVAFVYMTGKSMFPVGML
jgi:eukaryotic-like serine/threonine-protein kinase